MNGKPPGKAFILFENPTLGVAASAAISDEGTYQLRSQYGEGIPPGDSLVSFSPPPSRDDHDRPLPPSELKIPRRYLVGKSSQLTASVKEGSNVFDFTLDPS